MNSYAKIQEVLNRLSNGAVYTLSVPENAAHGDYATNIAFLLGKEKNISPAQFASEIVPQLAEELQDVVEKIEIAGPGFINFYLKDEVRTEEVKTLSLATTLSKGKILIEYTDPNCFKVFHIGHLMANAIGESISRLYEASGYDAVRVCYPADIGRNVAMGVWGMLKKFEEKPPRDASLSEQVRFLGVCYAYAYGEFETNEEAKQEIIEINKAIYAGTNERVMEVYAEGRALSLTYFDSLYERLGTTFDEFIYESETAEPGERIVREFLKKGLFEESEGAIVYKGEQDGLHTRVFVNSLGLPLYETKDIGNYEKKIALVPDALSYIVITAVEQAEYFKVINAVEEKIHPELKGKLVHISHGMMRLPSGKMSSRTGNVISAEELIEQVSERITERLADMRIADSDKEKLTDDIAIGAIKFSILKSSPGKDTIFDFEKSLSFEGDSGPYLQYTHARICALLDKAASVHVPEYSHHIVGLEKDVEQALLGYQLALAKACQERGPHHVVQHLLVLARAFNAMYGRQIIVDEQDLIKSAYYVMLAKKTKEVLAHGLNVLGIKAPERM